VDIVKCQTHQVRVSRQGEKSSDSMGSTKTRNSIIICIILAQLSLVDCTLYHFPATKQNKLAANPINVDAENVLTNIDLVDISAT
jgi:hypothetical protein